MPDEEKCNSENIMFCYINYPLAFCELSGIFCVYCMPKNVISWASSELALKYV